MTTSLSNGAANLWAKTGSEGTWHPLWCHLLDVTASAWEVLELEPRSTLELLGKDWGISAEDARVWTCFLAGLHDIGKATPVFQKKNRVGMERVEAAGLKWTVREVRDVPHGVTGEVILEEELLQLGLGAGASSLAASAVGAHHGWRSAPTARPDIRNGHLFGDARWTETRRQLVELLAQVLRVSVPQTETLSHPAFQRLAGLTSFADWIGSGLDFGDSSLSPAAYFRDAQTRARTKLAHLGWRPRTPLQAASQDFAATFAYLSPGGFQPRPLQLAVQSILGNCSEPTLLLVEAPMGEGKTEAAFYATTFLQRLFNHRGLYAAMPTRATGNAMYSRTVEFVKSCGRDTPVDLQLLHGATLLNEQFQQLLFHENDAESSDGVTAEQYFNHRKRALLSEFGVGTIDQALITILPVKHQFVRLWGLGNRVVLLDEVHAYDAFTGTLMEQLLQWLRALGSSVILLSATLPARRREQLLRCWGATVTTSVAYPRVICASGGQVFQETFPSRELPVLRVGPGPSAPREVAATLLQAAEPGGCVGCIVNTVGRAQEIYQELKMQNPELDALLFHARYPIERRQQLEQQVLSKFGKGVQRPRRCVLIATQVVEQSLDLDFDVIFTDLAPIDLVLQRAGRLHRHDQNRGKRLGHEEPVLHILGLQPESSAPDFTRYYWDKVYLPYILSRSWLTLKSLAHIDLSQDIEPLVESVYSLDLEPCVTSEFAARLATEYEDYRLEIDEKGLRASRSTIGLPDREPDNVTPSSDPDEETVPNTVFVSTRDCRQSIRVVPLYRHADSRVSLDAQGADCIDLATKPAIELAKRLFQRSLSVSRVALIKAIQKQDSVTSWDRVSLLAGLKPLWLDPSGASLGRFSAYLCPELGLVYGERKAVSAC